MPKNLIISAVGDKSCHKDWILGNPNFILVLIYYGNNDVIFNDYKKDSQIVIKQEGQKFPLINNFINNNKEFITQFDFIWLPDDDLSISTENLNELFDIANEYQLSICQPSVVALDNNVVYNITRPQHGVKLKYTKFVEVMAPMFSKDVLMMLYDDFILSESGWGLDFLWPHKLNYPQNKIAIIDKITVIHTKPLSTDYSRFKINPRHEYETIIRKFNIRPDYITHTILPL